MIVSPDTILFAIKALIRVGTAVRRSYEDSVVGQDFTLPGLDLKPLGPANRAALRLKTALDESQITLPPNDPGNTLSDIDLVIRSEEMTEECFLAGNRLIKLSKNYFPNYRIDTTGAGIWVVKQWEGADGPPKPAERLGLALVEVGLEYVSAHPGAIGLGGNADKLIAGVARNISSLLPKPGELGDFNVDFAEKSVRIFVQASLITLDQQVDTIVEEKSVQALSKAVLGPLIKKMSQDTTGTERWYDIRDELLGPISEAAIGVLVEHQGALLGKSFEKDTAIGAVTHSVLLAIKDHSVEDDLGREGLLRIYKAALGVAVEQPGLFVGEIEGTSIGQNLLSDVAALIASKKSPFTRELVIELTVVSIESVGRNAPTLFDFGGDWGKLATAAAHTVITEVSAGLAEGVSGGNSNILDRLFNKEQANRLFKILIDQATANPGMIVGKNAAPELRMLTEILARAMAEQNKRLLSSEDWLSVAATAAKEIAQNPNRLIKLDVDDPASQLVYKVISRLLKEAAADFERVGREGGGLLFGETLAQVISDSLEAAAGNAGLALENDVELGNLVEQLNHLNRENKGAIGRREWRYLFRLFVADVLDTGKVPDYSPEEWFGFLKMKKMNTEKGAGN
jgi:hypothetical protein